MNKRLIPVLALALAVSGLATFVVYRMLAAKMTAQAQPAAETQIVVASKDLQLGALLTEADVKLAAWPGPAPKAALTTVESAVNRGVITPIYEGEPVVETRLAAKGAGGGLAATIPMGMRAVAVRVNEVVGVAGFVIPGMRVDVLISGNPPNATGNVGTLARTVLQNIEVLSAGQKIEKNAQGTPESVSVVNLLVTPEQAETLSLASNQTQIQLVLRNPLDTKEAKTPGTTTANLFSGTTAKPIVAEQPRTPRPPRAQLVAAPKPALPAQPVIVPVVVEVFHGSARVRAQFQGTPEEKN